MAEVSLNLLTEPLFSIATANEGEEWCSLPEVLYRLGRKDAVEFAALQRHQGHAWHAFLVHLAAIALHQDRESTLDREPERWRTSLLNLTSGQPEPWALLVEDLVATAFLQPPVPEQSLSGWKEAGSTADEIDFLVTGRNHDLKARRIRHPRPEHWVYALVTLQTMSGYPGKSNYGIARMNGGLGNRPCFSVSADLTSATRFGRDVRVLLERRAVIASEHGYPEDGGTALWWTTPWDGKKSAALRDCDPLFIEVCRRIRLRRGAQGIVAYTRGSDAQRLNAKEALGNVGDIWTPIQKADGKSLTASDLSYDRINEVVLGSDWRPSEASIVRGEDGDLPWLFAWVLVRGQGKTEGMYERQIPMSRRVGRMFARPDERERLGQFAKKRIEWTALVWEKILRPSLIVLLQHGRDDLNWRQSGGTKPFKERYDAQIDSRFFEHLFADVEAHGIEHDAPHNGWLQIVVAIARSILREATTSVPLPAAHFYRAVSRAESFFENGVRKHIPDLNPAYKGDPDDRAAAPSAGR